MALLLVSLGSFFPGIRDTRRLVLIFSWYKGLFFNLPGKKDPKEKIIPTKAVNRQGVALNGIIISFLTKHTRDNNKPPPKGLYQAIQESLIPNKSFSQETV